MNLRTLQAHARGVGALRGLARPYNRTHCIAKYIDPSGNTTARVGQLKCYHRASRGKTNRADESEELMAARRRGLRPSNIAVIQIDQVGQLHRPEVRGAKSASLARQQQAMPIQKARLGLERGRVA